MGEMEHRALNTRIPDQLYEYTTDSYPEVVEPLIITGRHSILINQLNEEESKKINLSKYWDERSKARAKRAKRSRSKIDREWASGQQEKSQKIDDTFMSLYEKELEMTEELTSDIEETIKKYEEQKFVIPNKKNLKLRVKPGKNPYLDPKYRKTKFKSRMDYLSRKGVPAHVGDIAPMAESLDNFPKEEKGDGNK